MAASGWYASSHQVSKALWWPGRPHFPPSVSKQAFTNRASYETYIDRMLEYARKGQVRLPVSNIFTRLTSEKYTTWVDDMFMGIPFLVQAAQYATSPEERRRFLDDAAEQYLLRLDVLGRRELLS